jgi:superfamily II DNA or RNA helicase
MNLSEIEERIGKPLFPGQVACIDEVKNQGEYQAQDPRVCVYYPTGKGKTVAGLAALAAEGYTETVVIAPPATHTQWFMMGQKLGIHTHSVSHAKFRQKDFKLKRTVPVIADEFHLFGGHSGKGWKKLNTLARHLQAPLIAMSATPNYNDADRVFCIQSVLDPHSVKGGFLEFLYKHCITQQNNFGMLPDVIGFQRFNSAAEYLASLPGVLYLPDDLVYTIEDIEVAEKIPAEMEEFGYNRRRHRVIGSIMEARHTRVFLSLINDNGHIEADVMDVLIEKLDEATTPILIYANHSTVADALHRTLKKYDVESMKVTGETSPKHKDARIQAFNQGHTPVLIGTATLATGPDGMDKVCNTMIILDDTDDDALRRQLIGRIMPRGEDTDASIKKIFRIVLS